MQPSNPPAGIDINLIRQALLRRMGAGGVPPMTQQISQPGGSLPTGGPNVTAPQPAPMPPTNPSQLPSQTRMAPASSATPMQSVAGVAQNAGGFPDEETRKVAKTLLAKLVQFL